MQQSSFDNIISQYSGYIAGSVSGIAQVFIGQPFDMVKVRMQASTNPKTTVGSIFRKLMRKEGISGFYKGTMAPLVGVSGIISIQFGINDFMKEFFRQVEQVESVSQLKAWQYAIGGAFAGAASTVLSVPVEHIRIRMQLQKPGNMKYFSTMDCLKSIYSQYGMRGLYRGYTSGLLRDTVIGLQYGLYEILKNEIKTEDQTMRMGLMCTAGGVSGFLAWMAAFPIDSIKSRMQGDSLRRSKFRSTLHCYQRTSRSQLFKGLGPCLARSIPVNAGGFFVYEQAKTVLQGSMQQEPEF